MRNLSITYYTDPLCCWSWAMDPVLQQLNNEWNGIIDWQYRMGGLLPGWKSFSDPVNAVTRPIQMGPVWMHAAHVGNVFINHHIWLKDPPSSSYLACIACKAVAIQSEEYAIAYFRLLQKTCLQDGINIAGYGPLVEVAAALQHSFPDFEIERFKLDITNGEGKKAFQQDLNEVATRQIQRFPTLIIRQEGKPSLMMQGYGPFKEIQKVIQSHFTEGHPVCQSE